MSSNGKAELDDPVKSDSEEELHFPTREEHEAEMMQAMIAEGKDKIPPTGEEDVAEYLEKEGDALTEALSELTFVEPVKEIKQKGNSSPMDLPEKDKAGRKNSLVKSSEKQSFSLPSLTGTKPKPRKGSTKTEKDLKKQKSDTEEAKLKHKAQVIKYDDQKSSSPTVEVVHGRYKFPKDLVDQIRKKKVEYSRWTKELGEHWSNDRWRNLDAGDTEPSVALFAKCMPTTLSVVEWVEAVEEANKNVEAMKLRKEIEGKTEFSEIETRLAAYRKRFPPPPSFSASVISGLQQPLNAYSKVVERGMQLSATAQGMVADSLDRLRTIIADNNRIMENKIQMEAKYLATIGMGTDADHGKLGAYGKTDFSTFSEASFRSGPSRVVSKSGNPNPVKEEDEQLSEDDRFM